MPAFTYQRELIDVWLEAFGKLVRMSPETIQAAIPPTCPFHTLSACCSSKVHQQ